ncbi:rRNA biogenesis RRP36-like protein [Tasmannia lanceolata]|uniref:rRNA biogenesis RRP36-like protein n=1 Tax=Tasmannia lanceolata TaxID=3420 RepID=UPI004062AEBB
MVEESDEQGSSSEEEEDELERELADVSFEELQKARSNGFHSSYSKPDSERKVGRANKNRPMEISSKKPVGRFRQIIQVPKKVVRDPRFESLSGTLDVDGFKKRYSFLFEVELPKERAKLQKLIKKSNDPKVIEELKNHVSWIDNQLNSGSAKGVNAKILSEHKKKEREALKRGKQPFYLKKSEIRERELAEKYNNLKAAGKLESFLKKKRRRNASKDHRYIPYRRTGNSEQQ